MKELNEAKEEYESIPIPRELSGRVLEGIRRGQSARRTRRLRQWTGGMAACFAAAALSVNLSPAAAAAAADLPVLGPLFQVLTVRDFTDKDDDRTLNVEQPAVEGGALAQRVNQEIQDRVDAKIAQGEQLVAEYKAAFFATGGTQEEWEQHENTVSVTYEIKSQKGTMVSFAVNSSVSIASAYEEQVFYNLDLANGREITLADLLGSGWVAVCNDAIRAQMAAAEDPAVYFDKSMGGFATVDETTGFYVNQDGDPVVVFPRAAVAVGAMGSVEFVIPR